MHKMTTVISSTDIIEEKLDEFVKLAESKEIDLELGDDSFFEDFDVEIEFTYTPPCKGSRDEMGRPMEPDEDAIIDDLSVSADVKNDWDITDFISNFDNLNEVAFESAHKSKEDIEEEKFEARGGG